LKLEASGATICVFMTDCFELLQEPRRPWLEADALKARFLELSAAAHPDRVHGGTESERAHANARSAELNAAYNTLRESRDRLFHLLELERGAPSRDIQRIPAGTMDLFVEIGQCCRDADTFLATNPNSESPMLKLQRMRQALEWSDRLMALQRQVNLRREVLETTLRGLNAAWESAPPPSDPDRKNHLPLESLEDAARAMSYVSRWTSQLQERLGQLAS
jgi:curved DNA-binding protein CbpA